MAATDTPIDFSMSPDYLARLIVKVRAIEARVGVVDPQSGSNPTDDQALDILQEDPDDLSRLEVVREIQGLNERQQAELVALLWTGRGDAEPEDWNATIEMARERKDSPTPKYLLSDPLLAEYWQEGASRIGLAMGVV